MSLSMPQPPFHRNPWVTGSARDGRVMVTGANGFIGARLVARLRADGYTVRRMVRKEIDADCDVETVVADLSDTAALRRACDGVEAIVHCAGHAHAFGEPAALSSERHRRVNLMGTCNVVEAAVSAGVKRLIFMSSVKAMGDPGGQCADESWGAPPVTPYGTAKRDAENVVLRAGREHSVLVTNLRLAMVYGPGSRGNLERMAAAVRSGWFPPLPETGAKRSFVHVDDVVDAVLAVLPDPRAFDQTFIVAHAEPVSPARLYELLCHAVGRRPARHRVPEALLRSLGVVADLLSSIVRKPLPIGRDVVARLVDSECYLPAALEKELGWVARIPIETGILDLFADAASSRPVPEHDPSSAAHSRAGSVNR